MFPLGHVYATPGALELLNELEVPFETLLARHVQGDFGELGPEDVLANHQDIARRAGRVVSSYNPSRSPYTDALVWVITDLADEKTYTTVLLPEDY